eukprot:1158177-Pelagomonas_calceolata.AAC.6
MARKTKDYASHIQLYPPKKVPLTGESIHVNIYVNVQARKKSIVQKNPIPASMNEWVTRKAENKASQVQLCAIRNGFLSGEISPSLLEASSELPAPSSGGPLAAWLGQFLGWDCLGQYLWPSRFNQPAAQPSFMSSAFNALDRDFLFQAMEVASSPKA